MRHGQFKTNHRTRRRLYLVAGVLSLSLWLFMAVAETCPPLHAWLHGGTVPDDDDCAIVAIAHGKIETVACAIPVLVPVTWTEVIPRLEFSVFSTAIVFLPNGRAPPAFSVVS
jgi:hypothetical protein